MGSCHLRETPEGWLCIGNCTSYCPPGPSNMTCREEASDCEAYEVICTRGTTYKCINKGGGLPQCVCIQWGTTDRCYRFVCD